MTLEELWQAVLAQIQLNISPANFTTWFKNTSIANIKDGVVEIATSNNFTKEWLEQKYNKNIFKILHELDKNIKEVKYIINNTQELKISKNTKTTTLINYQLEFPEFKVDKETNLNSRYTFENFIVGPFNELPHAAGLAVSKNPGFIYNPLFIYGGVGLGKTHLLQAIGNSIVKSFPEKKIRYIPSEKFISGVISAIRNQEIENFKSKYRQIDVLIIDDIQFLSRKEKTQEEFFHIFNTLYEKNKQIIISSDRPPKTIPALTERLRSRFEGGMIADISLPDYETLFAILKTKIQEKNIDISDEILNYIALNSQKNIRELEGMLNKLIIFQKMNNKILTLEIAKDLLKNLIITPSKTTNPKKIIKIVAEFYDLKEKDLINSSRKKEIVNPRQIAMYLLKNELKCSYSFIGRKFQGKDHTTIIHACEKISKELEKNKKLQEEIESIKQLIYNENIENI